MSAPELSRRRYVVTSHPEAPRPGDFVCMAINALQALDFFAAEAGFGSYEDSPEVWSLVGTDEYGFFAGFENTTIWALPLPDFNTEARKFEHEGLQVTVTRNELTGQLFVGIATEKLRFGDSDGSDEPYIEVMLDEIVLYDYSRENGLRVSPNPTTAQLKAAAIARQGMVQ